MIQNLKLGFKLLKYGYKIKTNVILIVIMLVAACLIEIFSKGQQMLGGFYFMLIGMFTYQMIISMDISEMVQTSPMKRKMQIDLPVAASTLVYLVVFTFVAIEKYIVLQKNPENQETLVGSLVMIILCMLVVGIFTGIAYKSFWLAFILMFAMIFGGMMGAEMLFANDNGEIAISGVSYGIVVVAGYISVFVVGATEYLIGTLLYKKPLSEYAFRGIFKDM